MLVTVIVLCVLLILLFVYLRGEYNENYWKKKNVPFYAKNKSIGPFWEFLIGSRSMFEILGDIYKKYKKDSAVGLGSLFGHALFVSDPKNILYVTQEDFHSFHERGIPISDEDTLANNILFIGGPRWKLLRQKLTPLFTSAKLKNMYYIIDRSAQDFVEFLKQKPDKLNGKASDIQDTLTNFGAAALSAAVFGMGTKNTFDSPFRKMVTDAVAPSITLNLKLALGGFSSKLYKALGIKLFAKYENIFVESIRQVISQRVKEGVKKHDFVDMCVTLQKNGTMHDPETNLTIEPTDEVLAAQAFFFFIAGIEPTAFVMFTTMMELGLHPDILKRVHEEVDAVFEQYHDRLTYDAVVKVQYLDKVLSESLRFYPPLGYLTRQCMKDTILPVGNIPIKTGTNIFFSVFDLHHDPNYFPNPEVFDPDRFSREGEVNDTAYMPYGQGYRYCIGSKYARLQILSGLMHFLKHFTLNTHVCEGGKKYEKDAVRVRITNVEMEFMPRSK